MQEQAELLAQAVSIFKLSHDQMVRRSAPAPRPAPKPVAAPAPAPAPRPAVAAKPAAPKKLAAAPNAADEWEEF
jgi:methyl-accepting chemotaxis protein